MKTNYTNPSSYQSTFELIPSPRPSASRPAKRQRHSFADGFEPSVKSAVCKGGSGPNATYKNAVRDIRASIKSDNQNPIQKNSRSILLAHPNLPEQGIIVLFHGWSAGTWQYEDISKKLYESGYTVYAPRLPGHGYAYPDGLQDNSYLPKSSESGRYDEFVKDVYAQIEKMPTSKSVLGFSGGGAIAMRMIEKHPDIEKGVLIAPYLRPQLDYAKKLNSVFKTIDPWTHGGLGMLLNQIPYTMGEGGTPEGEAKGISGHAVVSLGNIYGLTQFGERVLSDAKPTPTAIKIIMSESDKKSDTASIRELKSRIEGNPKNSFFEFPSSENVPHGMVHPKESDCSEKITNQVYDFASEFLLK